MARNLDARAALAAALLLALAGPAAAEDAFATAPVRASSSAARLLSSGPMQSGVYHAGVEIDLNPKTVTYWRSPGDAGSPPIFDFSRSRNVASVEVAYPAPKHIVEEGSLVAGYDAKVIFPLRVTPRDAKQPATLDVTLDYAACGKICLPAKAQLSLVLPASGVSPHVEAIATAEGAVPRKLSEAEAKNLLAIETLPDGGWRVRYLGKGRIRDLFAEVPEPLFLESKPAAEGGGFELKLVSSAKAPPGPAAATLTLVTDNGAFEAAARLK